MFIIFSQHTFKIRFEPVTCLTTQNLVLVLMWMNVAPLRCSFLLQSGQSLTLCWQMIALGRLGPACCRSVPFAFTLAFTLVPDMFLVFFSSWLLWRSIWTCCLFCWMKACPSQDSNFLNYHWIWFDQSKRSALTLWSQFCRLMNRYAPCRNSRICFAIFLHFARSAK